MNIIEANNKLQEYYQLFSDSFVVSKTNGVKVKINRIVIAPSDKKDMNAYWEDYKNKSITLDNNKSYDVYFLLESGLPMDAPMTIEELMKDYELPDNKKLF